MVSYLAPNGSFSASSGMFASNGVDNAPLHVAAHAGLYLYGGHAFPTNSSDSNYWVDPVFNNVVAADTTAPVISAAKATVTGTTMTVTWTTDEPSSSSVDYGT